MKARMLVSLRLVDGDRDSRSLYVGDIVEGQDARDQIALGNAEQVIEDEERESAHPAVEQATARPGELR